MTHALAVCFAREALRGHKATAPVSAPGQVVAALLGVNLAAQMAMSCPVLAAFVSEGVRAVLARLDAEADPVMLANGDEDLGLVSRADAATSAQQIANQDSRTITVRDVLTDQLLATVHPQATA